jgi:parallel beta-helix repeat protein
MTTYNTRTVKPSGGDYTSLSNWEAGRQANLVALDYIEEADCYNMQDTTDVVIDGWTTGVNNYITILGASSDKTNINTGLWSTQRYRLEDTAADGNIPLTIAESYVRIAGLQIAKTNAGSYSNEIINISGLDETVSQLYIDSCIVKMTPNTGANVLYSNGGRISIRNSIIYGGLQTGITGNWGTSKSYWEIDNCTITKNGTYGISSDSDGITVKNSYLGGNNSGDLFGTIVSITNSTVSLATAGFVNVADGTEDFHLQNRTVLLGFGTDLTTLWNSFWGGVRDIDDHTRISPWNIGACQGLITNVRTIKPSGGSYTSLSNWEAGRQTDINYLNAIEIAECYAMNDTSPLTIDGWTTSSTNYILIRQAASDGYSGKWDTSKYYITGTGGNNVIQLSEEYVRLDHIQIDKTASSSSFASGITLTATGTLQEYRFSNCIIRGTISGTATAMRGINCTSLGAGTRSVYVWNCDVSGFINGADNEAKALRGSDGFQFYVYNTTLYNNYQGINTSATTFTLINTIFSGHTIDVDIGGSITGTYCSTTNSTAAGLAAGTGNRFSQTFTFRNAGSGDFHLASTDAGAKGYGQTNPGSGLFLDDIDGKTRIAPWDIGADQYGPIVKTVTVKPSGGSYTSLNNAFAGEITNLVTIDTQLNINCYAMQDTTPVYTGVGWATDATRYVQISTPTTERHSGVYDTSKYRLETTSDTGIDVVSGLQYLRIIGLQFQLTRSTSYSYAIHISDGPTWIDSNIIKGVVSGVDNHAGIALSDPNINYISNNLIYGFNVNSSNGIYVSSSSGDNYIYNNTFVNNSRGIDLNAFNSARFTNNIFRSCGTCVVEATPTYSNYNATDLSSLGYTSGSYDRVSQTFTFANEGAVDYHLTFSDMGARGHGANLSADPYYAFTNDLDGQNRSTPWDIGADAVSIRRLQSVFGASSSGQYSIAFTLPNNVVVGNVVVITAAVWGGTTFVLGDATKTAGTSTIGAIQLDNVFSSSVSGLQLATWSVTITGTGSLTVTVTHASSDYVTAGMQEYIGIDTASSRFLSTSQADSLGTTYGPITSSLVIPLHGVFIGLVAENTLTTSTYTPTTFNLIWVEPDDGAYEAAATSDLIVTTGTTSPANWYDPMGTSWSATNVAYRSSLQINIRTVKTSAGDYTSLSNWEAGRQGDIASLNFVEEAECYSMVDTAQMYISGWTTGVNNYIKIYTPTSERHRGKWDASKYVLSVTDNAAFSSESGYLTIDGLQITTVSPTGSGNHIVSLIDANSFLLSNCIFKGHNHTSYTQYGVWCRSNGQNTNMFNCLIYNIKAITGNYCVNVDYSGTKNIYSCTAIGGQYGIARTDTSTLVIKNCYCGNSSAGDFHLATSLTTCASSDVSGSVGLTSIAVSTTTFFNVTAGSDDYHLFYKSALKGVGTNTSGDTAPLNFTVDIDGQSRGTVWDIGADQQSILRVQSTGNSASSDPIVLAYPSNVTSGNLLVFCTASYNNAATLASVTKTSGSATLGTAQIDISYSSLDYGSAPQIVTIFSVPVTGTGSCTITFDQSLVSANYSSLTIQEYSGADITSTRVGGTNTGTGSTSPETTGTVSSGSIGGVFVGAIAINNEVSEAPAVGSNFLNIYSTGNPVVLPCGFEDYTVPGSVTIGASWTTVVSEPWGAAIVVYKAYSSSPAITAYFKNINNIIKSNIKSMNGVLIANVKNVDGLS